MDHPVDMLTVARAEALFASDLSAASEPTAAEVADAIRRAIHLHGGTRGCAAELAAAYGDRPETAVPRMRWARRVVARVYGSSPYVTTLPGWRHRRPAASGACHGARGARAA